MQRRDGKHMAKKVMNSDVEGIICKGRPKLGCMDGTERALGEQGVSGAGQTDSIG